LAIVQLNELIEDFKMMLILDNFENIPMKYA